MKYAWILALLIASACAPDEPPDGTPAAEQPAPPDTGDTTGGIPAPADSAAVEDATIASDRVGHVRLGQSEADVRSRPVRDTTLQMEGMEERALVAAVGGGEATALLVNGVVDRIIVRDPALRTEAGVGVGSTLEELRAAYGAACAAASERGGIAVWFDALPGVSFALEYPQGADLAAIERDPSSLPGNTRVEELWVHGARVECPAR